MNTFTDGAGRVTRKIGSALRAPLLITLGVIAIVGAGYYAFYRGQVDYYTGRNLRLISTLTAQIEGRIATNVREFRDGTLKPDRASPPLPARSNQEIDVKREPAETGRGWAVRLHANGAYLTLRLDDVLRPLFARRVGTAFDLVLIANEEGQILYSVRTPPPASSLLTAEEEALDEDLGLQESTVAIIRAMNRSRMERESRSALVITDLGALAERRRWREYAPLEPKRLLTGTEQLRVRLGDDDYLLFAQPYPFARAAVSSDGKAKPWIVCGLVSEARFRYDVSAISASVILIAVAIALLALCCWPFLRIALIHPGQELTIGDVALIVICTAVGASVLTLALFDFFAYRRLGRDADEQLHKYAETVVTAFADNVKRAMTVLTEAERAAQPVPTFRTRESITAALRDPGRIGAYPYFDWIAWADKGGRQQARFDTKTVTPFGNVGHRQYFRDALIERTWTAGGEPYVLEWVRSRATGEVRAVVAKNTNEPKGAGDPKYPVIAMATELIDITYGVRPPGVELAIIDENGEVVYHSDVERIGYENFFTETDRNRALRSAVLARRKSTVSASYWGEDKSMFVRPLTGSPWTLIVYRARRLTRVLNVEAALLTLVLLLIASSPYVVLYIFALILAPQYRAPSLWPDETRRGDYLRLCAMYLALLFLFGLTVYLLTPWSAFFAVAMIPAVAVLTTYLVLHRVARPRTFAIAATLWVAANATLFVFLLTSEVDAGRFFSPYPNITKSVLAVVAVAVAAATAMVIATRSGKRFARLAIARITTRYSVLYRLCGVLLLVLCAALPVAAFFNISRHVQSELLVKYGQLRAAADLEHRIARLETLNVLPDNPRKVKEDIERPKILQEMFGSRWRLEAQPLSEPDREPSIPVAATSLVPALYEDSIAIRPLFDPATADRLWQWKLDEDCSDGGPRDGSPRDCITLERKVRFDVPVSQKLWPGRETPPSHQKIVISSLRSPPAERAHETPVLPMLLSGLAILLVFWYAVDFIASRVLLMDIGEPHWMARLPLSPTLGDQIFLVRRDKDARDLTGDDPMGKGLPFLDVSFEELARANGWDAALEKLDSSAVGRNVRIADFEYGINDDAISLQKLQWLERLLSLADRTVLVISTVTPAFVLSAVGAEQVARWRALLDRFVIVTAEELELRSQEWKRRQELRTLSQLMTVAPKNWLEKETAYNPFLRRLRDELDPTADRAHLVDEISERAETYYAGLWATCREDEKLLLYQLARNRLANGRNRRTLRRLIARGLVRRDPNVELFSETFRLYVLAAAQREDLVSRARAEQGASTWDTLRVPFFVVIISFLLLLFATQKDLLTTTTALVGALTTGLPLIMKLVGVFSEKRAGAAEMK